MACTSLLLYEKRHLTQFNGPKLFYSTLVTYLFMPLLVHTLQRKMAENWKQIFPEKEYRGLSPNFHIQMRSSLMRMRSSLVADEI